MAPQLTAEQMQDLFPFHFVVDGELRVSRTGRSLSLLVPGLVRGAALAQVLSLKQPCAEISVHTLIAHADGIFVFEAFAPKVQLRGQFVPCQEPEGLMFLGSPVLTRWEQIRELGLTPAHFALSDPTLELLEVVRKQEASLGEVRRMADRLAAHRGQLRQANQTLHHEIAERRISEAALREQESDYRTVVEAIKEVVFRSDTVGAWTLLNPAWAEITGFSVEESLGRCSLEYVHPDDRERHRDRLKPLWEQKRETSRHEVRFLRKQGDCCWMEIFARISVDQHGVPDGIAGTMNDVTERHRAEEKFRALFHGSPMAQLLADDDGILDCNQAAVEMVGASSRHDLITTSLSLLSAAIQPDGRSATEKLREMAKAARESGCHKAEWTLRRADGSGLTVEFSLAPVVIDGRTAILAIWRDLAETRRIQAELRRSSGEAEQAGRVRLEFLGAMSQEIRTPMSGIMGMAGMLLESELTARQRACVETVRDSGQALLTIINDIRDYSRIESGKLAIVPAPFDLLSTVEEVAELLQRRAEARGLELVVRYAPGTPRAFIGDGQRWHQALLTLGDRAIRNTARGHVLMEVAALETGGDSARLCIAVIDTGSGVLAPEPGLGKDPWSGGAGQNNAGVGLNICHRLLELMGGKVSRQCTAGSGTRCEIDIRLPLDPNPPGLPTGPCPPKRRCLVVDDHPMARRVLGERLGQWHIPNASAGDRASAMAMLRQADTGGHPFEVVFIDDQMPGGEGLALARAIARDGGAGSPVLVALTSHIHSGSEPADGYQYFSAALTKPLRQARLWETLSNLPARREPGHATGAPEKTAPAEPVGAGAQTRVLVAENQDAHRTLARTLLEEMGCRVDLAANGAEAVRMAAESAYDVIFLDCRMPGMDGFEAARQLRSQAGRRAPIVGVTVDSSPDDPGRCLDAGMDDHLSKPINPPDLGRVLARWTARTPSKMNTVNTPPFDLSGALKRVDGDQSLLMVLAKSFVKNGPQLVDKVLAAIAARDLKKLATAAHSLKGTAALFDAHALVRTAQNLEAAARDGDWEAVGTHSSGIREDMGVVEEALKAFLEGRTVRA